MSETKPGLYKISANAAGEFDRKPSVFRDWVRADGSTPFTPDKDRYHLYVSLACPWACRTLLVRRLKGLEAVLPYTVVDWFLGEDGWTFTDQKPQCSLDPVYGKTRLKDIYLLADPQYNGRITVPVLWDKKNKTIVNNESSEIIRMLNKEFNSLCPTEEQRKLDLCPADLLTQIDEVNAWVYDGLNNGVYRSGFAQNQTAYDKAVREVFQTLDRLEEILSKQRYLCGERFTEADVRAFVTLVRFDLVYVGHFKCNKKRIIDYPSLWGYTRDIYQMPGVKDTVDFEHIAKHYQESHRSINPLGIVAIGPELNFLEPHGREKLSNK